MSKRGSVRIGEAVAAHQEPSANPDDEMRVSEVLEEYLAQIERGERPDRYAIVSRHPDLADQLRACLDGLDLLQQVVPELHEVSSRMPAGAPEALGDFRILRELGRGGMGVVYEAEQLSLGRRIALKVLPFAAMLDKQQLARFKNEARAAATLDHPNIVAIYSVGSDRGVHFYAMQLIEGHSLAELIAAMKPSSASGEKSVARPGLTNQSTAADTDKAALDTVRTSGSAAFSSLRTPSKSFPSFSSRDYHRAIAHFGIQAAEALDHAHQNGILHRDIKPANLMVDETGKLWITDFGLARIEQDAGMTVTGDLLGTLRYMSPEQALAKRVVVDHRSDIYSLGLTLYELLTLQPAFAATDRSELLKQIAFEEPKAMRQINRHIPVDLETIIAKAIEKDPADRLATAQELADDLKRFLDCQPIKARPATALQRLVKWSRRHVAVVWSIAAILLISSLILVIAGLQVVKWYQVAADQLQQTEKQERIATGMSQLFEQLITSVEPDEERGPTYTVRQMLDDFCAALDEKVSDQPEVEAALRTTIGTAYANLGFPEKAKPHFESALELRRKVLDPNDDKIAATLVDLGWNWFELHKSDKVNQCAKEAVAIYRRNNASPEKMVHALYLLQKSRNESNKHEADAAAAEALAIAGDLNTTLIAEVASVLHTCAETQFVQSNYDEAELLAHQAVKVHRRLNGDRHVQTAWGLISLGHALHANQKYHEAAAAFREARGICREHSEIWHKPVLAVNRSLITSLEASDEAPEELQAVRQELIAGYRELKQQHPDEPQAYAGFAQSLYQYGNREQFAEGIAAYQEAIRLRPIYGPYQNNLGVIRFVLNQRDEAIAAFRQAIALNPRGAAGYFNLAVALHDQGHGEEAADQLRIAIQNDSTFATRDLVYILRLDATELLNDIEREPAD